MPTPSSNNSIQSQVRKLKKAIQSEVHRKTGVKPPVLANNANFQNAITYNALAPENAWYIVPNAANANKIIQLYAKNTLKKIIQHQNVSQRRSPFTRKPITNRNIKKYMNFGRPPPPPAAPVVINLTRNHHHQHAASRPTASIRTRHGMFSEETVQYYLKRLLERANVGDKFKIKTAMRTRLRDKTHFFIEKINVNLFYFRPGTDDSPMNHASTNLASFTQKLLAFATHNGTTQAEDVRYVGYRKVD